MSGSTKRMLEDDSTFRDDAMNFMINQFEQAIVGQDVRGFVSHFILTVSYNNIMMQSNTDIMEWFIENIMPIKFPSHIDEVNSIMRAILLLT